MNIIYKPSVTSSDIYVDLLKKIINLDYMPGDRLSENELCEKYGTTRHTVRGALAVLKEKGLVDVVPQKGTYVSLINLDMIDDILFLRSAVEQETLHAIFKKQDNSELLAQLKECLEKQKIALQHGDKETEKFYEIDDSFHSILLDAIGKTSVQNLYYDAYLHVRRWRNMEVSTQKRKGMLAQEHHKIIDAIEAGDEDAARKCMDHHINSVQNFGEDIKTKYPQYFI